MRRWARLLACAALACCGAVGAQTPAVLRDLEPLQPVTLSKDELALLLPGAQMKRISTKGNLHVWRNEAGGSFVISSDNRDRGGRPSTAPGKWHLSDDGRYCVLVEWKTIETEEWCRYVIKTSDGYYAAKSDKIGTEKVYKLEIDR